MERWKRRVIAFLEAQPQTEQIQTITEMIAGARTRDELLEVLQSALADEIIGPNFRDRIIAIAYTPGIGDADVEPFGPPRPSDPMPAQERRDAGRLERAAEVFDEDAGTPTGLGAGRIIVPAIRDARLAARTRVVERVEDELDNFDLRQRPSFRRSRVPEAYKAHAVRRGKTDYVVAVDERIVAAARRRRAAHDFARGYNFFISLFGTLNSFEIDALASALKETMQAGTNQIRTAGDIPGGFNPPFNGQ